MHRLILLLLSYEQSWRGWDDDAGLYLPVLRRRYFMAWLERKLRPHLRDIFEPGIPMLITMLLAHVLHAAKSMNKAHSMYSER